MKILAKAGVLVVLPQNKNVAAALIFWATPFLDFNAFDL